MSEVLWYFGSNVFLSKTNTFSTDIGPLPKYTPDKFLNIKVPIVVRLSSETSQASEAEIER